MLGKSQVKYIQSLGQKKHREEEGVFIAEGPKIVGELLESGMAGIRAVYAVKEWIDEWGMRYTGSPIIEVTGEELERISQLHTPNKVLAVAPQLEAPVRLSLEGNIVLALDSIQDPGNLGTIIRIADWFGVRQIAASRECADLYNPKVVQSSMGSLIRVKMLYTDLPSWLGAQFSVPIYAAQLDGQHVGRMEKLREGIIVIGNESRGISDAIMQHVHIAITIPRLGEAESLNAAVATGIILSHLAGERGEG